MIEGSHVTFNNGTVTFYLNGSQFGDAIFLKHDKIEKLEVPLPYMMLGQGLTGKMDDLVVVSDTVFNDQEIDRIFKQGTNENEKSGPKIR